MIFFFFLSKTWKLKESLVDRLEVDRLEVQREIVEESPSLKLKNLEC